METSSSSSWLLFLSIITICNGFEVEILPDMDAPLNRHWYDMLVQQHEPVTTVYRGDSRSPQEILAYTVNDKPMPGFYPKQGPVVPEQYGLFSHVEGNIKNTAYVSTTDSLNVAADHLYKVNRGPGGYIYKIQTTSTIIDVNRSLLNWRYRINYEHAAMGGIPYSQIEAYVELTTDVYRDILQGREKNVQFVPNDRHVPARDKFRGSSVKPELAGYPSDHPYWKYEPWKGIRAANGNAPPDLEATFKKNLVVTESPKSLYMKHRATKLSDLLSLAETRAAKEFPKTARRFGLRSPWAAGRHGSTSWEAIRLKLSRSPVLRKLASPGVQLTKLPTRAFLGAGLGLWVKEMLDSFSSDASTFDSASVALSVVPFLGCTAQAVANEVHRRRPDHLNTALCFLADGLTMTPLWPVGVALHIIRAFLNYLGNEWEPWDSERLQKRRAEGWAKALPSVLASLNQRAFYDGLETQFQADVTAVVFAASESRALIEAAASGPFNSSSMAAEAARQSDEAKRNLHAKTCAEIEKRKQNLLRDGEKAAVDLVVRKARRYDDMFFERAETAIARIVTAEGVSAGESYGKSPYVSRWIRSERAKEMDLFPTGRDQLRDMIHQMAAFYLSRRTARVCLPLPSWDPPSRWYGTLSGRPEGVSIHGKPVDEEPLQLAWAAAQLHDEKQLALHQWLAARQRAQKPDATVEEMTDERATSATMRIAANRIDHFRFRVVMWARRNRIPKPEDWALALADQMHAHYVNLKSAALRARMDEDEDEDEDEE
ncbi:hypothetical protein CP532_4189 [Ophiocordyceps camponoti-leonardi (nom. inval.)]|nr:hypothetical protein CP532_4189 [Ophiocordyceps camponoti-leonardi (nom. inval.)]